MGKYIGLLLALCAPLTIGKNFAHITAGIAQKLAKLKPFRDIYLN